jgi:hypothetical protein
MNPQRVHDVLHVLKNQCEEEVGRRLTRAEKFEASATDSTNAGEMDRHQADLMKQVCGILDETMAQLQKIEGVEPRDIVGKS